MSTAKQPAAAYEVAIVGGGPAGLSAGIWLGRYLRQVVLIDAGDPRNWETRGINGVLGQHGVTPADLRSRGRDECRQFGVRLVDGEVLRVRRDPNGDLRLLLADAELVASRLLLAIGIRDVWPDIPGLERCYGETAHVCPDCDGYEARGRKIVVIGDGIRAVNMALALTTWTSRIIICTNGARADIDAALCAKLDAFSIPVLESRIRRMHSTRGEVQTMELENGMELDCERVFFSIGQFPADDLGTQLSCKRDKHGLIEVDHRGATSVRNVFAAGDITADRPQLVPAAAASGTVAALAIHRSLLPPVRRLD